MSNSGWGSNIDPDVLRRLMADDEVALGQYLGILRKMQEAERSFPGARIIWPEMTAMVARMIDRPLRVQIHTRVCGEFVPSSEAGRAQPVRFELMDHKTLKNGPYQGLINLTGWFMGHQRILNRGDLVPRYVIVLTSAKPVEGKSEPGIMVPVTEIVEFSRKTRIS